MQIKKKRSNTKEKSWPNIVPVMVAVVVKINKLIYYNLLSIISAITLSIVQYSQRIIRNLHVDTLWRYLCEYIFFFFILIDMTLKCRKQLISYANRSQVQEILNNYILLGCLGKRYNNICVRKIRVYGNFVQQNECMGKAVHFYQCCVNGTKTCLCPDYYYFLFL